VQEFNASANLMRVFKIFNVCSEEQLPAMSTWLKKQPAESTRWRSFSSALGCWRLGFKFTCQARGRRKCSQLWSVALL